MTDRQHRDLPRRTVAGRRRRRGVRPGDPGPVRPAPADQLPRPDHVRGVDRARRDPRRPPAVPVLRARPDPLHDRDHRVHGPVRRTASGSWRRPGARSPGAAAHLAIRAIGTTRTSFRIRPAFAIRTAAFARVPAADGPADVLGRHRAADHHLLHAGRRRARGRGGLGAQLRARLPGPAGQPHRRLVLAGRLPGPVGGLRRRRRTAFRAILVRNLVDDRRS